MAITGMHALIYSRKAGAARKLLRDVFGWRAVDAGGGWLIFAAPPAEVAVHPAGRASHALYLVCDDIGRTVAWLKRRKVRFAGPVVDRGWGLATAIRMPGGDQLGLYEPRHPTALRRRAPRRRA